MAENRYVFDNAVTAETGMRFSGLEVTYDPATIRYLTGVGVADGWACWEIGAGGGSIANWLATRVGPAGSVLATDIDPRFIPASELGQLAVVRHDVTTDAVPAARYDLIHARLLLSHLPQRGDVMHRLVRGLRPGGWLVIEDFSGAFERGTEPVGPARVVFDRGGSPSARVIEAGLRQAGDRMIAAGLVDRPALDEAIAYLAAPTSVVGMPTMVSAWGRRE